MRVRVDSRLRVQLGDFDATRGRVEAVKAAFAYDNPDYWKKRRLKLSTRGCPPRVATWRVEGGCLTLPRGGTAKLRRLATEGGYALAFQDARHDPGEADVPLHTVPLRGYQEAAVRAMLLREQGILRAPVGSGKTTAALALIARARRPALVVLWSSNLLKQWEARCEAELGLAGDDLGVIRGHTWRLRPVTL